MCVCMRVCVCMHVFVCVFVCACVHAVMAIIPDSVDIFASMHNFLILISQTVTVKFVLHSNKMLYVINSTFS